MRADTVATIYNRYRNPETRTEEWRPTTLRFVHWEAGKGANIITSGLASADGLFVMIPFAADAGGKMYLPPLQYAALSPSRVVDHWTVTEGTDRIIKGDPESPSVLTDIKPIVAMDHCYTVTAVDAFDFGRVHMRHWEVYGK